ncbi:MAG: protein kinase [Myxococcales bacterium]|nr:protein kinase [Myxococcales bacterium]
MIPPLVAPPNMGVLVGGPARVTAGPALAVDPAATGTALVPPMAAAPVRAQPQPQVQPQPHNARAAGQMSPARTVLAMVPPANRISALKPSDPRPTPADDRPPSSRETLPPIPTDPPHPGMPSARAQFEPAAAPVGSSRLIQSEPATATTADGVKVEGAFFPVGGIARPKGEVGTSTAAWEDSLIGRVLDQRYRIDARIGAGAMGMVFKATHVIIDKPLAIKMLRADYAGQPDVIKRFLLEAQLASKVKHPNVVDISDYGQLAGQTAYYVMEYLSGTTLAARIDAGGRMDPALAVDFAIQTAQALQAAHQNKIIHRDLKSENIFLCDRPDGGEPQVKILDFGIARIRDRQTRLTANGALIGTPAYMSPEQAQGMEVDERSDLYALGIILFEMLAGRVPFKQPTVAMILSAQIFDTPPLLRDVEPGVPELPHLERVIRMLLAKNRDERPGDAAEVIHLIKTAAEVDLAGGPSPATSLHGSKRRATVTIGSWSVADTPSALLREQPPAAGESHTTPYPPDPSGAPRPEQDAMVPRSVSASGRIQRRPSVIVPSGTPVERIAAPPTRQQPAPEPEGRHYPTGLMPAVRPAGPPMILVIAAAASIGAAITVTLYKQVWRRNAAPTYAAQELAPRPEPPPAPTPPPTTRVTFDSDPPGATVMTAAGEVWGTTPFTRDLVAAGPRVRVVFKLPGHDDSDLDISPAEAARHKVHLRPSVPTPTTAVAPADAAGAPAVASGEAVKSGPATRPRQPKVKDGASSPSTADSSETPETKAAATPPAQPDELEMGELKNPFRKK